MSNNSINKILNLNKSKTSLGNLLDTSVWLLTDDKVTIRSIDYKPIISSIKEISLYEAIYIMVLNNISVIKNNNIYMLEPLINYHFDNIKIPETYEGDESNFKEFLKNCHELINEKIYVLNHKKKIYNIYSIGSLSGSFGNKLNNNITDDLEKLEGGSSTVSEITAILNTLKINNMTGGSLAYCSNPNETIHLLKTVEKNFNLESHEKNKLENMIQKHAIYTEKLNKLNDNLKKFNNINNTVNMDNIPNAVKSFEKTRRKNKKNNKNIINLIENALGIYKNKTITSSRKKNMKSFSFYHLDKIILNKFIKNESQQNNKTQMNELEEIERLVNELTDTVDSTMNNL